MGTQMEKLKVGVFFGGRSGEHDVSLVSGTTVMEHLDKEKYDVYAIGIRRDGSLAAPFEAEGMLRKPLPEVGKPFVFLRPAGSGRLLDLLGRTEAGNDLDFDLFFPVLHGTFGEDGTLQGLLDMTGKPYVGCGVLGSSAGMDKDAQKLLFRASGLEVVPWVRFYQPEMEADREGVIGKAAAEIGFPCFVKPCRLGSSVGISKAHDAVELGAALDEAFLYDYKVLVEKGINAREIECSVLGNHEARTSPPGEIIPSREFYDYEAKYVDDHSRLLLPADLGEEAAGRVRDLAAQAFLSVGAEGYARVDFLLDREDGTLYLNEINTIPGFTAISMFPKLWELAGLSLGELLDELIRLALERHAWKAGLKTSRG